MSNTLSIQANAPVLSSGGGSIAPSRASSASPTADTQKAKPVQLYANPTSSVDPTLGLVVLNFHDDTGKLINTMPSQRQLDAYRMNQATPPGQHASPADHVEASAG
jgi:hypothetical protein